MISYVGTWIWSHPATMAVRYNSIKLPTWSSPIQFNTTAGDGMGMCDSFPLHAVKICSWLRHTAFAEPVLPEVSINTATSFREVLVLTLLLDALEGFSPPAQ
jgi:hypothetical protein